MYGRTRGATYIGSSSRGGPTPTASPFVTPAVNANPSFNPVFQPNVAAVPVDNPGKSDGPGGKPPKAPDKPLAPYMKFSKKVWEQVKAQNPDGKMWDIGKIIGQMWRELSETDKMPYIQEYEVEKVQYDKALEAYRNSPAYQQYLQNKAKGGDRGGVTYAGGPGAQQHRAVLIQPVDEDEDSSSQLSGRQLAAARFRKNHRLIATVFNEAVVPDMRGVITQQRMTVLKRQVNSLTSHQHKLENELSQLEDKFQAKKKRIEEDSKAFTDKLAQMSESQPTVDDARLEELISQQTEKLAEAYKRYQARNEQQQYLPPPGGVGGEQAGQSQSNVSTASILPPVSSMETTTMSTSIASEAQPPSGPNPDPKKLATDEERAPVSISERVLPNVNSTNSLADSEANMSNLTEKTEDLSHDSADSSLDGESGAEDGLATGSEDTEAG